MTAVAKRQKDPPAQASGEDLPARLLPLRNRILKLADATARRGVSADDNAIDEGELLGLLAEEVYRERRRRAQHFSQRLFGEPGWDILLDLYAAAVRGETVSVSNACRAADAPPSTALRWLQHLEDDRLVERIADPTDARRHFVRLSKRGLERMRAYFAEGRREADEEIIS
jgi:DNA-binding MarR family transcriptional regulator